MKCLDLKRLKIRERFRVLVNKELCDLFRSPVIVRVVKYLFLVLLPVVEARHVLGLPVFYRS
jgi:hypothetical protein